MQITATRPPSAPGSSIFRINASSGGLYGVVADSPYPRFDGVQPVDRDAQDFVAPCRRRPALPFHPNRWPWRPARRLIRVDWET